MIGRNDSSDVGYKSRYIVHIGAHENAGTYLVFLLKISFLTDLHDVKKGKIHTRTMQIINLINFL